MHPARWLEIAFGSESRVRVLRFLLTQQPPRPRTEREIAGAIGMSPNAVNQAVRALHKEGLLEIQAVGRAHAVRLVDDPLLRTTLEQVFASEADVWSAALRTISANLPEGISCYLYGSSARGSATGASDVDLLIVAKSREKATDAAHAVQVAAAKAFPMRLHVIALSEREAKQRAAAGGLVKRALDEGQILTSSAPAPGMSV